MIFCPKCEQEFPDTVPTWRECNVEFVSSLKEDEFPELAVICTILMKLLPISSEVFLRTKIFLVSSKTYPFMQSLLQSKT